MYTTACYETIGPLTDAEQFIHIKIYYAISLFVKKHLKSWYHKQGLFRLQDAVVAVKINDTLLFFTFRIIIEMCMFYTGW
jgi:hypothetical protein